MKIKEDRHRSHMNFLKSKSSDGKAINRKILEKYKNFMTINPDFYFFMCAPSLGPIQEKIKLCESVMAIA
jgi:hypothetical protein